MSLLLCMGAQSVWGQTEIAKFNHDNTTGWTLIENPEYTSATGGYYKLTYSNRAIVSPAIVWSNYEDITIEIKARKYGGPDADQGRISVFQGETELADFSPTQTSITSSGELDITPSSGAITIACPNASSNKGCGVQEIIIRGTLTSSAVPTAITIDATAITNTDVYSSTTAGTLSATVTANNTPISGATVTWSSSDTGVATIASNGAVTLVAPGTTTITASYAGVANQYQASSATYELTVTTSDPDIPGTEDNPYTVAQALEAIDNQTGTTGVYAKGIVSQIVSNFNSQNGTITYNISDDGTTTSSQLQAYKGKSYHGDPFTSSDDIKVGDEVVIYGNLIKYNNNTYEFEADNQLVSLNRPQKADPEISYSPEEVTITQGDPFTAPTLNNPHDLPLTFASNNVDVATVDETTGEVTLGNKSGTAIISASFAGNSEYYSVITGFTLTVVSNLTPTTYVKVTNMNQLVAGNEYILVTPDPLENQESSVAMSNIYGSYRIPVSVTIEDDKVNITDEDVAVLTLGGTLNNWTFQASDDDGYLSLPSASNQLKSSEDVDEFTYWTVIETTNGFMVQSNKFADRTIRYNSGSPRFACYKSGQKEAYLYVKENSSTDERVETTTSFGDETYQFEINDDSFVSPTATVKVKSTGTVIEGAAVVYSSSNEEVAEVDSSTGELTLKKVGTATITATYEGNETDYFGSTASYTLKVFSDETVNFKKVTDISQLVEGEEYIIVYEKGENSKVMGKQNAANSTTAYMVPVDINVTDGIASFNGDITQLNFLTLGTLNEYYTFKTSIEDGYLYWNSGNYLYTTSSIDEEYIDHNLWEIRFDNNGVIITNVYGKDVNRQIMYNSSQPRFACYTGTQQPVALYKKYDAFDVEITSAEMGTLYVGDGKLTIPAGVTAKTLKFDADGTTLVASREYAAGDVLPAGEAVVIYGEEGNYSFEYTFKNAKYEGPDSENLLKGSDTATTDDEEGYSYYILGVNKGVAGFYQQKGTEGKYVNNGAHKAYLKVPADSSIKSFYTFDDEDTPTGIANIENTASHELIIYNLAGQRVSKPTKGIYIVNGKKVYLK